MRSALHLLKQATTLRVHEFGDLVRLTRADDVAFACKPFVKAKRKAYAGAGRTERAMNLVRVVPSIYSSMSEQQLATERKAAEEYCQKLRSELERVFA